MALVAVTVDSLYIQKLTYEVENNFYTINEAELLKKVKNCVNLCVRELTDTKTELICFLNNVNPNAEEFYNFVHLKNSKFSDLYMAVSILRKNLEENNLELICFIQDCKNRKEGFLEEHVNLESAKDYLARKMTGVEEEYQHIDSEIIQISQGLDTTYSKSKSEKILYEQYQDLKTLFKDLEVEIQDIYHELERISCTLDSLPEKIFELSNKNQIFCKIFLFVCDFEILARNCQLPLKHIITVCEANREPPSHLKIISNRNKQNLAAKVANVIEENLKYFDRISNQTLDFQVKTKAIEDFHFKPPHEFRIKNMKRNLLADFNANAKDIVSQNADYRWRFLGPWQYGTPVFLHSHYDSEFENKFDKCFETSYESCIKVMKYDLDDIGISHIVSEYQPSITFSEWVVNRADCGSQYRLHISLLEKRNKVIAEEVVEKMFQQWQLQRWEKVELKIHAYPPGVRYIHIASSGQDSQFWKGHYGVKMAGSELKINLEDIPPFNLITNQNSKGNDITRHADSRWLFTGPWKYAAPVFLDNHYHPNFEDKFKYCFETSYKECKKVLEVDINKNGMSSMLDYFRPTIIFLEWVVNRADCGSKYNFSLTLLDKSHNVVAETKGEKKYRKWHLQKWEKVELTIHAYPPGVRYIRITSSGQDTQYWEGHYGVKIAGSELLVKMT